MHVMAHAITMKSFIVMHPCACVCVCVCVYAYLFLLDREKPFASTCSLGCLLYEADRV